MRHEAQAANTPGSSCGPSIRSWRTIAIVVLATITVTNTLTFVLYFYSSTNANRVTSVVSISQTIFVAPRIWSEDKNYANGISFK